LCFISFYGNNDKKQDLILNSSNSLAYYDKKDKHKQWACTLNTLFIVNKSSKEHVKITTIFSSKIIIFLRKKLVFHCLNIFQQISRVHDDIFEKTQRSLENNRRRNRKQEGTTKSSKYLWRRRSWRNCRKA